MGMEGEGTMVFRAGRDVVITSPEQLAEKRIFVHPAVMEATWGPDAATRYQQVIRAQQAVRKPFNNGSISFK